MAETFLGEIRMFGGPYAPQNWAMCTGTVLPIVQNEALYSLLGSSYGGDGRTSFALPDLRGRVPICSGVGVNLTARSVGQKVGEEQVQLTTANLPTHTHPLCSSEDAGTAPGPANQFLASASTGANFYSDDTTLTTTSLASSVVGSAGGNQAHYNLMPYTCINFIIALQGDYPLQN